jgi:hypothetical protein
VLCFIYYVVIDVAYYHILITVHYHINYINITTSITGDQLINTTILLISTEYIDDQVLTMRTHSNNH